jgi:hypothetical protein
MHAACRLSHLLPCTALLAASALAAVKGPPMASAPALPDDRPREQTVKLTESPGVYSLSVAGEVDDRFTREPVGYAAYQQGWQLNRFVRLENRGETDVVNPWLSVNGRGRWGTTAEIAAAAVGAYTEERDRARAIWEFTRRQRFHATTWDAEVQDPVKTFNVYGYTLCGDDAQVIADLWKAAGLQTRRGYPVGHAVSEAFYDGGYHLLDGDEHCVYLLRDNETIAAEAEVVRDHDLIKRTHTYGILANDDPLTDQFSATLFGYEGERKGSHGGRSGHTMNYVLRPGESIEWRWDHVGKEYTAAKIMPDGKSHGDGTGCLNVWGGNAYSALRNGKLRYAPDLVGETARRGMASVANLAPPAAVGLASANPATPAVVVWRQAAAYVMVGGVVSIKGSVQAPAAAVTLELSADGKAWEPLAEFAEAGAFDRQVSLDERLSPQNKPQYAWWLRLTIPSGSAVSQIAFDTDLQMASLALPGLGVGENSLVYRDESPAGRAVRLTHAWTERPAWHRPAAPVLTEPAAEALVSGTDVAFSWTPPTHPDGAVIADYHLEVSAFADLRWPLSPNFEKLLSHTPQRGTSSWRVPGLGLLNPGTPYYWRVRARDVRGVWGPWSAVRSFRCEAPGVPLNLTVKADPQAGTVILAWTPNPKGTTPVRYGVFAADEKGFTASRVSFRKLVGRGFCRTQEEFEAKKDFVSKVDETANLLAETPECSLQVVGPTLAVALANRAFYRVVAVDAAGRESGPSDYAEAPRPFIWSQPDAGARAVQPWRSQPGVIRSVGDVLCRGGYNPAFWTPDVLEFALGEAPPWLAIDAATGLLSGTPPAVGEFAVAWRVRNHRGGEAAQRFTLRVAAP